MDGHGKVPDQFRGLHAFCFGGLGLWMETSDCYRNGAAATAYVLE
ncbi:MAG: hypothetical protein R2788_02510 [Saprospiraceae bacterium]